MGKTESILFGSKQKLNKQGHVNLNITCGNIIQSKSQVKYLGVELDQFLSGDCITTKIVGKSIAKLKFLYRQAKHFDMGTRKTLVSTLIQCQQDKQKLNKQGHVNLNITCGNIIQSKSQVKYLGVELDQFLSGDCITTKIVGKSIAKLKFLYRQAKHFDMGTRKTLVSTLIQCHMDYACSAWYTGLSKRNKIVHGPESENLPPPREFS